MAMGSSSIEDDDLQTSAGAVRTGAQVGSPLGAGLVRVRLPRAA